MELGEHEPNEPPVADCDCRRCAGATRDALRKDAERLRDRVERLRGLCKWASGKLLDAGDHKSAVAVLALAGDSEGANG